MPELPDISLYLAALRPRLLGARLEAIRLQSPFLLRSVAPPLASTEGHVVTGLTRIGKRIVIELEGELFLVIHLMIAGRFQWTPPGVKSPGKRALALFAFSSGTLALTEAGTKRRASLHLIEGALGLAPFDRGGLDVNSATPTGFAAALRRENHTLKRALTDPRILDGIGNAYSDEILHRARLSPLQLTSRLDDGQMMRLLQSCQAVLHEWTLRLIEEAGDRFPKKVTAFRAGMAVHGRFNEPCPDCGAPVQRIRYAENETNYCARCQTGGRLLADRGLSRLLKEDWPRTLEELEEIRSPHQ
ncbi:MAG: DNA-formamidopyrimidine glycosylase family protein [Gemmatimonadota bacterium]